MVHVVVPCHCGDVWAPGLSGISRDLPEYSAIFRDIPGLSGIIGFLDAVWIAFVGAVWVAVWFTFGSPPVNQR